MVTGCKNTLTNNSEITKQIIALTGAPWLVRNSNVSRDLKIDGIRRQIRIRKNEMLAKFQHHTNHLMREA